MSKTKNYSFIHFLACGAFAVLLLISVKPVYSQSDHLFNKRPFIDLADKINSMLAGNEVDLNAPFSIEVRGDLSEFGKLERGQIKNISGDEKITEVGKEFVAAISDSEVLTGLRNLGFKQVVILISQDENNASLVIRSEAATADEAKKALSTLNLLITSSQNFVKNDDEKFILRSLKPTIDEKKVELNFLAPHEEVQQLIRKILKEREAEKNSR